MKIKNFFKGAVGRILDKLKEKTTWIGLALCASGILIHYDIERIQQILETCFDLIGMILVFAKEHKDKRL